VQLAAARGVYGAATEAEIERWLVTVTQARDAFAATQDDAALAEAWLAIEYLEFMRGQLVPAYEATVRALACGLRAGRLREAIQSAGDLVTFAVAGPMPFAGIRQLGLEMAAASDPIAAVSGLALLAAADLAEGSPDQGAHEERRRATIERHGLAWLGAVHALPLGILELQAGSADLAEHRLMQSRQTVLEFGDVWWINSLDPRIAQAQEIQGRTAEFLRTADAFDAQIRVFDRDARISRLLLRALAALHRGALADAQAAVREALDATSGTDLALLTADAHAVAARILDARGFATEATRERSEAAAIHRAKGNITALRAMGLVG